MQTTNFSNSIEAVSKRHLNTSNSFQKKAWEAYLSKGLPKGKEEAFRYFPLHQLYQQTFSSSSSTKECNERAQALCDQSCTESTLVFLNGRLFTSNVKEHFLILPMEQALKTYGSYIKRRWQQELSKEENPFSLLNFALHDGAAFIYLPPNVDGGALSIINLVTQENSIVFPRFYCFMSKNSQCQISYRTVSHPSLQACSNSFVGIHLEENSHLKYYSDSQTSNSLWGFETLRAQQKRDSSLEATSLRTSGHVWREDYHLQLLEKNSQCSLQGAWLLNNTQQYHANVLVEHAEEQCYSKQFFKGALDDYSRSSFNGKIYVHQKAQQTDAFQLNNNLLLSDNANANTMPNLEIFADDVKASHGATVGQLDPEQLFYLNSRGLDLEKARALLVQGYISELIDSVSLAPLKERWQQEVQNYLS